MGWYDWFALVYDPALEAVYRNSRKRAALALDLAAGGSVLDVPCGTGQSFKPLYERVQPDGQYLGVDLSPGMLSRARQRGRDKPGAHFLEADAGTLGAEQLARTLGQPQVDRLHIFLGLTAIPAWEQAFANLWSRLRPGGRCVIVDVYAERRTLQGRVVETLARADITRQVWVPFEQVAEGYDRQTLSTEAIHGGELWLACGRKPLDEEVTSAGS